MMTNAQVALQAAVTLAIHPDVNPAAASEIMTLSSKFLTWLDKQDAGVITEEWPPAPNLLKDGDTQ